MRTLLNILIAGVVYIVSPTAFVDTFFLAFIALTMSDIYRLMLEEKRSE